MIDSSVAKAIQYLAQCQLPDGEFRTEFYYRASESEEERPVFDSSPFVTSLVLHSLQSVAMSDPAVPAMIRRGCDFLLSDMEPAGLWRYWSKKNDKRSMIPPDLDDTSCISYTLRANRIAIPDNRWLFHQSRDRRGLFYTWLYRADTLRKKLLAWRTGGKAFSYRDEIWQFTQKDDVCSVVNANVILYLGETSYTRRAIEWLLGILRDGSEDKSIVFYAHRFSLYYMLTRAYSQGVSRLAEGKSIIADRIRASQDPGGGFGDELLTGQAVCSLLNLGIAEPALERTIEFLLGTQRADGSWRRIPMYGGPPVPTTFGSADLTTAVCLEALARYKERLQ
jgi:hypothetical protein